MVACAAIGAPALVVGCGGQCRAVETRPLDLACAGASPFIGELHFDSPETFETFLAAECLPDADADTIAAHVASVDFTVDVAFVAVGLRAQIGRCIVARRVEAVEVCEAGLRLTFADEETDDEPCASKWTVAVAVPRGEMRAALAER